MGIKKLKIGHNHFVKTPNPTLPSPAWLDSDMGVYLSFYALLLLFESIFICNWLQAIKACTKVVMRVHWVIVLNLLELCLEELYLGCWSLRGVVHSRSKPANESLDLV